VIVALLAGAVVSMWWSITYQRRVLSLISTDNRRTAVAPPLSRPDRELLPAGAGGGRRSAEVLDSDPSVLWWDSLVIVSALAHDGVALVGCRRSDGVGGGSFSDHDQTVVLLIGDDHRADAAMRLLDRWRCGCTPVLLQPFDVAGTVELADDLGNAIRATLLAA
jgi:hypothetical protein